MRMDNTHKNGTKKPRRQAVNLSIRADIIKEAKALGINASRVAEDGLAAAVKKAKEEEWLKGAQAAIKAHNERVDRDGGPLIKSHWID